MSGTHLTGLEGTNPLGFLAALGVQTAFADYDVQPRLWWSDGVTPHAVVDSDFSVERIADQALTKAARWKDCPSMNPSRHNGRPLPKGDELKLAPGDIRTYLSRSHASEAGGGLAAALVAEGSLDNNGVAKPSDLYFAAGRMKFLLIARTILGSIAREDLLTGLVGPWSYTSEVASLGWDVVDDRIYALRANNPDPDKKLTNPGPEALAILGLSCHPVFAGGERTLTQGCSGSWKAGRYSWPLWRRPAAPGAVKSLLAHAYDHPGADRSHWYPSWGVFTIFRSPIRRSPQGGYGTFGPPEVAWQQH
ncbi:MAG: hypothetical protein OXH96_06305 [Spirochaetaceae bacterium]|nr:hypothetical protein [Spirochaetaceae bacterium]